MQPMDTAEPADDEAACLGGIAEVEAALPGVADANARREAEDELEEMREARADGEWDDCLDAMEEAMEAIGG